MRISAPHLNDLHSPLNSPRASLTHSPLHSQTSSESVICWICLDDESHEVLLGNICGCKSRCVHGSCLAKWIDRSNEKECKVCTEKWPGVFTAPPSEIISVSPRRTEANDIACFSTSLLFSNGFVYGLLYASFGMDDFLAQFFIATIGNAAIIGTWNMIFASPARRTVRKRACEDVSFLIAVYSFFLMGWMCGYMLVLPDLKNFLVCGITAHGFNFASCFFVAFLRCFCVNTEVEAEEA